MPHLLVVSDPTDWPINLPGVEVVSARAYLADSEHSRERGIRVFNLCRHYRYQATGYYVTLLAEARGHRPLPDISAIQGFRSTAIARETSAELGELIDRSLSRLQGDRFELSVYFGRNLAKRYARLSQRLFGLFTVPLLRAFFRRRDDGWQLGRVEPIPFSQVPPSHREFVIESATEYFERKRWEAPKRRRYRYDLAILHDPDAADAPSDAVALNRFARAAAREGVSTSLITKQDYARLAAFDALFIRETTSVNHHTYRFARRARSLGLAVIDDPDSILRCSNKVYLAELLNRHDVPSPRTMIVHRDNAGGVLDVLGLPCVLKQPDSAFSLGVVKVATPEELSAALEKMLARSDLVIAQEFAPTEFDWRIGVLERQPLFAARYHMAAGHWQIVKRTGQSQRYGKAEAIPLEDVPRPVLRTALRAANLIGDGLYGVDLKQVGRRCQVIEVNDNPNLDGGVEDKILRDELYHRLVRSFLRRIDEVKQWPKRM